MKLTKSTIDVSKKKIIIGILVDHQFLGLAGAIINSIAVCRQFDVCIKKDK